MAKASREDDMAEVVAILFFSCALFVFTEKISNMQLCCPLERILFLFGKYPPIPIYGYVLLWESSLSCVVLFFLNDAHGEFF